MNNLRIATVQFENKSGDKAYNLSVIDSMCGKAAAAGADVACFHECSITGYTFARHLSKEQLLDVSELIPDGPSTKQLISIAKKIQHRCACRPV